VFGANNLVIALLTFFFYKYYSDRNSIIHLYPFVMYIIILLLDNNKYKCLYGMYYIFNVLQYISTVILLLVACLVIIIYAAFFIHFRYHNFLALGS